MTNQIDEIKTSGNSAPRTLEIEHESCTSWLTWSMLWGEGKGRRDYNEITVYKEASSIEAMSIAMKLNIFGVDAPKMGEWWLNANRRKNEGWEGQIVAVSPHCLDGFEITHRNTQTRDNYEAITFRIILPYDRDFYKQGTPYYTLQVNSSQNIHIIQSRTYQSR